MGIIISFILFLLLFFSIKRSNYFGNEIQLNNHYWLFAFSLKNLVGFFFIYYFLSVAGSKEEPSDVFRYMEESKFFHDLIISNTSKAFQILFDFNNKEEFKFFLSDHTFIWASSESNVFNDSRTLIRIHTLLQFCSFNSPYFHVIVFNFLSLISLKKIIDITKTKATINIKYVFFSMLFFPSLLFWTSGILKETFLFIGIAYFLHGLLIVKRRIFHLTIGSLLLIIFKPYILLCAIPAILFYIIYQSICKKSLKKSILTFSIIIISFLSIPIFRNKLVFDLSMKQFHTIISGEGCYIAQNKTGFYYVNLDLKNNLILSKDSVQFIKKTKVYYIDLDLQNQPYITHVNPSKRKYELHLTFPRSNTFYKIDRINFEFKHLLLTIPQTLLYTTFKPFPVELKSSFAYLSFIENWAILLFLLRAFTSRNSQLKQNKHLIVSFLIFVTALYLLTGFTSPILGLLIRYRLPAQLVLLLLGLILIQKKKEIKHE